MQKLFLLLGASIPCWIMASGALPEGAEGQSAVSWDRPALIRGQEQDPQNIENMIAQEIEHPDTQAKVSEFSLIQRTSNVARLKKAEARFTAFTEEFAKKIKAAVERTKSSGKEAKTIIKESAAWKSFAEKIQEIRNKYTNALAEAERVTLLNNAIDEITVNAARELEKFNKLSDDALAEKSVEFKDFKDKIVKIVEEKLREKGITSDKIPETFGTLVHWRNFVNKVTKIGDKLKKTIAETEKKAALTSDLKKLGEERETRRQQKETEKRTNARAQALISGDEIVNTVRTEISKALETATSEELVEMQPEKWHTVTVQMLQEELEKIEKQHNLPAATLKEIEEHFTGQIKALVKQKNEERLDHIHRIG